MKKVISAIGVVTADKAKKRHVYTFIQTELDRSTAKGVDVPSQYAAAYKIQPYDIYYRTGDMSCFSNLCHTNSFSSDVGLTNDLLKHLKYREVYEFEDAIEFLLWVLDKLEVMVDSHAKKHD